MLFISQMLDPNFFFKCMAKILAWNVATWNRFIWKKKRRRMIKGKPTEVSFCCCCTWNIRIWEYFWRIRHETTTLDSSQLPCSQQSSPIYYSSSSPSFHFLNRHEKGTLNSESTIPNSAPPFSPSSPPFHCFLSILFRIYYILDSCVSHHPGCVTSLNTHKFCCFNPSFISLTDWLIDWLISLPCRSVDGLCSRSSCSVIVGMWNRLLGFLCCLLISALLFNFGCRVD